MTRTLKWFDQNVKPKADGSDCFICTIYGDLTKEALPRTCELFSAFRTTKNIPIRTLPYSTCPVAHPRACSMKFRYRCSEQDRNSGIN